VTWAGTGSETRPEPPADLDEAFRRSVVRLSNDPVADPLAIQRLTKQNVTVGIAGNRFFDPFFWDKVHYFLLSYDDQGRIQQAREISDPKTRTVLDQWLDFEWDGLRLMAVHGFQGTESKNRVKIYDRTMQYQGNQLVSEDVQYQGKSYKTKYVYNNGRLATAQTDRDPSLDDRARQVTFR
jgi:hypothetical protein